MIKNISQSKSLLTINNALKSDFKPETEFGEAMIDAPFLPKQEDKDSISLDDALEKVGVGAFNYKLTIIGGIAILSSYLAVGVMAFTLPAAHCDLHMTTEEKGRLASASFIGLLISCHLWGFLSDTLGRRYVLIRCLFFDGALYFITMLLNNYQIIFILRLLNGIASCGGVVSIYAYIGEFQPKQFRLRSLMIASLVAANAYYLLPSTAWLIIPGRWQFNLYPGLTFRSWRLYYIICGAPSLVASILLFFIPESPKFLLAKGESEKVLDILRRMHKENGNEDKFTIKSVIINDSERIGTLAKGENQVIAFLKLVWNQTIPLLKPPHVKNMTLIAVPLFATFFCNNGIYIWLVESLNRLEIYANETGTDSGSYCEIVQYGHGHTNQNTLHSLSSENHYLTNNLTSSVEKVCHAGIKTSVFIAFTTMGICQLIAWLLMVVLTKHFNKKYLLIFLTTCSLLTISSFKISNNFILLPVKDTLIVVFTSATFPILNSVCVDLFPTNFRAMAGCLALMASRFGTVTVNIISGLLIDERCELLLWVIIIPVALSLMATILLPNLDSPPEKVKDEEM